MTSLACLGGWRRATRILGLIPRFRARLVGAAGMHQPTSGANEVPSGTLSAVPYGTLSAVLYGTLSAVLYGTLSAVSKTG